MHENVPNGPLQHRATLLAEHYRRVSPLPGGDRLDASFSLKAETIDHLGRRRPVLIVHAGLTADDSRSGGASPSTADMPMAGASLYCDEVETVFTRDTLADDDIPTFLAHCAQQLAPPPLSPLTLLHAAIPHAHVDHIWAPEVLAVTYAPQGHDIVRSLFGDRAVWITDAHTARQLAQRVRAAVQQQPTAEIAFIEKCGALTWSDSPSETGRASQDVLAHISQYLKGLMTTDPPAVDKPAAAASQRPSNAPTGAAYLAKIRNLLSRYGSRIIHVSHSPVVAAFVQSKALAELATMPSTRAPEPVDLGGVPTCVIGLDDIEADSWPQAQITLQHAAPDALLVPELGLLTAGPTALAAQQLAAVVERTLKFQCFTTALTGRAIAYPFRSHQPRPDPAMFAGKVALITGAAGGIGRAICERLVQDGAHVLVADIDWSGAVAVADDLTRRFGRRRAIPVNMDVTSEQSVQEAFLTAVQTFGGVDIVVSNAGISYSAPVENTDLAAWQRNMDVLATGYFLVAREAFRVFKQQGLGGSLVFIASKNALVGGKNIAAYSAAKAAELHLARCLAEEGGPFGIRVNSVAPDAVLDTRIWGGSVLEERARTHGVEPDQLGEYYRQRSTLKVNVLPADVAEAVAWLASDRAAKTTGAIITVDGGVPAAYVR